MHARRLVRMLALEKYFTVFQGNHRMPVGGARPGAGRKKGGKNAKTLRDREAIWAYIEERTKAGAQANPFTFFVDTLADPHVDIAQRLHAATALADRLLPRLKSIDHAGEIAHPSMTAEERQATIQRLLAQYTQYAPVHLGNGSTGPVGAAECPGPGLGGHADA